MPTEIRIERPDGSTENPTHVASSHTEKFGEMDMAAVDIPRSEGVDLNLQEDEDEVILSEDGEDFFGGVLRDTESKEATMELVVDGWEALAADARRTPPGQRRENAADGDIVSEAVSASPRLTEGDIEDSESGLTLVFASASQARKARQTEEAGEGELRYNADLTVDYLPRLGEYRDGGTTTGTVSGSGVTAVTSESGDLAVAAEITVSIADGESAGVRVEVRDSGGVVDSDSTFGGTADGEQQTLSASASTEVGWTEVYFSHSGDGIAEWSVELYEDLVAGVRGGVTVSPGSRNTDGDVRVKKNTRVRRATHLVALGAGEGDHQRYANVVPESDPDSYDNEVRYDAGGHWSPGDRRKWDTVSNKDATSQSAVEAVGRAAAREVRERHVTVAAVLKGVDVSLGDTYRVEKARDNIDRPLRVVRRRRVDDSGGGLRYECDLSNRRKFGDNPSDRDRADTERYNRAFEGTPVTMTTGGGRQPVDGDLSYEFDFYYPDEVVYEHRVKLFVKGLAYRAYSRGAASGGDHVHEFEYIATGEHGHAITEEEFDHTHSLTPETSADDHGHGDGTLGASNHAHTDGTFDADAHPHGDGTLDADSHGHGDGTLGASNHAHTDGTFDADDHDHGDGTLGANSHGHGDGTLGAASHNHDEGNLDADSHDHGDGTLSGDSHDHGDGTLDADNHDHGNNITETSEANTPHGSVVADGSSISNPGDTFQWEELETISPNTDYELGVIHVHANASEEVIEVRARDSNETAASDTSGDDQYFTPRVEGTVLVGTSDPDGMGGSVTLIVPEDWGYVDVDYRAASDPNTNLSLTWMFLGEHTHDVDITQDTLFSQPGVGGDTGETGPGVTGSVSDTSPGVSGDSGLSQPGVTGDTGDTGPGVSGDTAEASPGVDGISGETEPNVTGDTGDTGPGVSGDTGETGPGVDGISGETEPNVTGDTDDAGPGVDGGTEAPGVAKTTETRQQVEASVTTTGDKDHTHQPDPGVIESFDGDRYYPGGCDVLVNGSSLGVSLGGGGGTFEEQVDLEGELLPGQVNTIEVTSDSLGHVQAHLDVDVYRQILGDG